MNYLSNFLLTTQLLPVLKQSPDGRVCCVNSSLHRKVGGPKTHTERSADRPGRGFRGVEGHRGCFFGCRPLSLVCALCFECAILSLCFSRLPAGTTWDEIDSCCGGGAQLVLVR